MNYKDIKDFAQRCEEHPDHQTGMISHSMIQQRLQDEVAELREYIESLPEAHAEMMEALGWQVIMCGACGYEGARAFPQPELKPLTDDEIHDIYDQLAKERPYSVATTRRNVARAIEAAHGIKENT